MLRSSGTATYVRVLLEEVARLRDPHHVRVREGLEPEAFQEDLSRDLTGGHEDRLRPMPGVRINTMGNGSLIFSRVRSSRLRTDLSVGHLGAATDPAVARAGVVARSAAGGGMEPTRGCALCAHGVTERPESRERAGHHGDRLDEAVLVAFEQAHALDQAIADPGLEYQRGARPIAELLREGLEGCNDGVEEADHVGTSDDRPVDRQAVKDDVRAERGRHRLDVPGLEGAAEGMGLDHARLHECH